MMKRSTRDSSVDELKPFRRPREYYEANDFFVVELPASLRKQGESLCQIGKVNSNWEGNEAVNRIKMKYCNNPLESEVSVLRKGGVESVSFDRRDESLGIEENTFNLHQTCTDHQSAAANDLPVMQIPDITDNCISNEQSKHVAPTDSSRKEKSPSAFGSFSYKSEDPFYKQIVSEVRYAEVPLPNITIDNIIMKINNENPKCIVFLDLDFFYKLMWRLPESFPSSVQVIAFYGQKWNHLPKQPCQVVKELYESNRFHVHPLSGIKKKGLTSKCLNDTITLAHKRISNSVYFIIMTDNSDSVQKLKRKVNGKRRNTYLLSSSEKIFSRLYSLLKDGPK